MEHQAIGSQTLGRVEIGLKARPRLGRQLWIGRGKIDEVRRVTESRGDRRVLRLGAPIGVECFGAVLGWLPHPWTLGEDLDNFCSDISSAL